MSEHVQDLLGAYALDALDEAEAALVSAHLAECASCRAQFAGLAEAAGRLADLHPADPSPQLRGRVLAAIQQARREPAAAESPAALPAPRPALVPRQRLPQRPAWSRSRWAQALAVVALAASQVWLIATLVSLRSQVALQGAAQTILLSSNEAPVNLQPADPASIARGVFHYEPDLRRGLLNYYHLPSPGSGRHYQCWIEFTAGPALSCGRLAIGDDGAGLLLFSWPDAAPSRVRVTLETGSSAAPAGPTVLLGSVPPQS